MATTTFRFQDAPNTERPLKPKQPFRPAQKLTSHGSGAVPGSGDNALLPRLERSAHDWNEARRLLRRAAESGHRFSPAGNWLLDNCHLVQEEIDIAGRQLPRQDGKGLPLLSDGPHQDLPRIYDLAVEFLNHNHARLGRERLCRYFRAYQRAAPLTLAELWATADMLRLALIEGISRAARRIVRCGEHLAAPAGTDEQQQRKFTPDTQPYLEFAHYWRP